MLALYEILDGDAMRSITVLPAEMIPAQMARCRSKDAGHCIGMKWLESAIATRQKLENKKYQMAAGIMRDKFPDLCKPGLTKAYSGQPEPGHGTAK
ncbi:hypothetical protein [Comamonas endophytica]|uniref:Uncharacterized protein n=1 Tax=Comamonas endophytica TaxID=2949090 RepID=A0ABY6GGB0_9BURK|nr:MULTISPECIES: hypothetical protein [unclassified Acidovorax]MCD2513327.1 hypothetical protein [Acidovorax sp. D4N7]UYG53888.1 hypothetical protein M9799_18315 [Acidovorax sp. 5MLIR]